MKNRTAIWSAITQNCDFRAKKRFLREKVEKNLCQGLTKVFFCVYLNIYLI